MTVHSADVGTVIVLCVAWLASAAALALAYVRTDRPAARESRRYATAMLIMMSFGVLDRTATMLNWPHHVQLAIDALGLLVVAATFIWLFSGRPFRHPRLWIRDPPSPRR